MAPIAESYAGFRCASWAVTGRSLSEGACSICCEAVRAGDAENLPPNVAIERQARSDATSVSRARMPSRPSSRMACSAAVFETEPCVFDLTRVSRLTPEQPAWGFQSCRELGNARLPRRSPDGFALSLPLFEGKGSFRAEPRCTSD